MKPKAEILQRLAFNLKHLRTGAGLTQQALADRAGYSRSLIGAIENGQRNITVHTLEILALTLRCDIRELLLPQKTLSS